MNNNCSISSYSSTQPNDSVNKNCTNTNTPKSDMLISKKMQDITLTDTTCNNSMSAKNVINMTNAIANNLSYESSITLENSQVTGEIRGDDVTANNCSQLGNVFAKNIASLTQCDKVGSVSGNFVILKNSTISNNVTSQGAAEITNATIQKKLTCSCNYLKITKGNINKIIVISSAVLPVVELVKSHVKKIVFKNGADEMIEGIVRLDDEYPSPKLTRGKYKHFSSDS